MKAHVIMFYTKLLDVAHLGLQYDILLDPFFFGSIRKFYDAALRTLFLKLSLDYFGVIIPLEVA